MDEGVACRKGAQCTHGMVLHAPHAHVRRHASYDGINEPLRAAKVLLVGWVVGHHVVHGRQTRLLYTRVANTDCHTCTSGNNSAGTRCATNNTPVSPPEVTGRPAHVRNLTHRVTSSVARGVARGAAVTAAAAGVCRVRTGGWRSGVCRVCSDGVTQPCHHAACVVG